MNIYKVTYREKDDTVDSNEYVAASDVSNCEDMIKSERKDRLGFDPIVVQVRLVQQDALISK